jgi:hypothetical protein
VESGAAPAPPADRRDPLNRKAIVAAAIRILDDGGLDGFTMRQVADALGTGPCLALLARRLEGRPARPDLRGGHRRAAVPDADPGRWQEQLKDVARTMRTTILPPPRHRPDIDRPRADGSQRVRHSDRVLAILRAGGASDRLAVLGHHLLISVVNGFTVDETGEERPALTRAVRRDDPRLPRVIAAERVPQSRRARAITSRSAIRTCASKS